MYTEYVFEEKKYDVASRDLKASLFDIVTTENDKLAVLKEKIKATTDPDMKAKLEEIANGQEKCLSSMLSVMNELTTLLQSLDSFSRNLIFLENQNMAEIVANIHTSENVMQQDEYSDVSNNTLEENVSINNNDIDQHVESDEAATTIENAQPDVDSNQSEEDKYVESFQMTAPADKTADEPVNTQTESVPLENDSMETSLVEEVATKEVTPVADEVQETSELTATDAAPVEDNAPQEVIPVTGEVQETSELIPTEASTVEDATSQEVIPVADEVQETSELIPTEASTVEDATSQEVIPVTGEVQETNEIIPTEASAVEDATPQEVIPVADEVQETSEIIPTEASAVEDAATAQEVIPVADEVQEPNEIIPTEASTVEDAATAQEVIPVTGEVQETSELIPTEVQAEEAVQEPVFNSTEMENENIVVNFKKNDNNETKAILTTANQVANLRASRDSQESILTAKQFFKLGGESNSDVTDEQLVDNGLLPPEDGVNEEQINQMMQEITQLYNEGKMDEAQALSEKVSKLSKEMQQDQSVMIA